MSLFSLPLVSASSLLFLLFWFSPVILHCPYYTGGINVTLDKGVTLNSLDYGNYGNHIQCARNAFEEAVRCRTKLKIPNFKLFSNPDPPFLGFDFRKVDPTVLEDYECKRVDVGACGKKHFFFHFQRPSLTPNQTMAVWECMGDLVNTDTLHECPNLENKLLIHIRNGDVLKIPNYLQPPFSSLLTTIYAKRWDELVVISSNRNPLTKGSGPIFDLFHALKVFFPVKTVSPPANQYPDHLKYWFCAKNLVTPFTTLNVGLPILRHIETLFTPDIPCFSTPMPFTKSYQQYSAPSSLALFFGVGQNKYFAPFNEDLVAKYVLTPTEPYTLCSSSRTSESDEILFQEREQILSRSEFVMDQHDLRNSLVLDFGSIMSDLQVPFCSVFGAIMYQHWERVIVLEDPILNQTQLTDELRDEAKSNAGKLKLLNQVLLFEGVKMLNGSVPVRFDFFPLQLQDQLKIVNFGTSIHLASHQSIHPNQSLLEKVFDLSGRGCVPQKWIHNQTYSLYSTTTTNTKFKEKQSSILFTQCQTKFQKCNFE